MRYAIYKKKVQHTSELNEVNLLNVSFASVTEHFVCWPHAILSFTNRRKNAEAGAVLEDPP